MSVIQFKVCEIVFDELKEKYDHFASHHRNIYLKHCTKGYEPVFFLPQYKPHLKHKTFLKPNPLYSYQSLTACEIPDQTCPFCRGMFFYKRELEQHHLENKCLGNKVQKIFGRKVGQRL